MDSRIVAIFSASLPGVLHELSSPLAILRNNADYLKRCGGCEDTVNTEDLMAIGSELAEVETRLGAFLDGLRAIPIPNSRGQTLDVILSSVCTVLRNELKYTWTTSIDISAGFHPPCSALEAWVSCAELVLALTRSFPEGGSLEFRSVEAALSIKVSPKRQKAPVSQDDFHGRLRAWATGAPFELRQWIYSPGEQPTFSFALACRVGEA